MLFLRKQYAYFYAFLILYFVLGSILILLFDKVELHLILTKTHTQTLDLFFKYFTHFGDGLFAVILITLVAIVQKNGRWAYLTIGVTSFAFTGILAQFFKKIIFSDSLRPSKSIAIDLLHQVEGVQLHGNYSFPSGHSTTTVVLTCFLAFVYSGNRTRQIVFGSLALLGCYSRIYLSQHFLEDTLAGIALGFVGFIIILHILSNYTFKSFFDSKKNLSIKKQ